MGENVNHLKRHVVTVDVAVARIFVQYQTDNALFDFFARVVARSLAFGDLNRGSLYH
jgi:hypothetical protein